LEPAFREGGPPTLDSHSHNHDLAYVKKPIQSYFIPIEMKAFCLLLGMVLLVGCGPLKSCTWSDDPKNWRRAFDEPRPADGISIAHSWYMRTPHFTAEYAWFFELQLADKVKSEMVTNSDFTKLPAFTQEDLRLRTYRDRPKWFAPEPLSAYEAYESKTERNFLIFLEKNGGRSFWTRYQL
jgi:hypothetical protein